MRLFGTESLASFCDGVQDSEIFGLDDLLQVLVELALVQPFELERQILF